MYTEQIGKELFLIDLRTAGYPCLFSSYVLKGSKSVIIDPGPASSVSNLLSGLSELGMQLEDISYVALSHVHIDHSGCTGALLGSLPNAKVIVHPRGAPHLVSPEKLWSSSKAVLGHAAKVFGKPDPLSEGRIISTSDGQEFDLGRRVKFKAVETLGHAAHHLSFYEFSSGVLFPGDAAGVYFREFNVVVPTSPPPFYPNIALDSLEKLLSYNPEALCYMHFGKADKTESRLRNHAQQIRLWLRIAEEGVRRGDDVSSIREAIFSGDNAISQIASWLKSHPILRTTVYENSCDGFIEFARKSVN